MERLGVAGSEGSSVTKVTAMRRVAPRKLASTARELGDAVLDPSAGPRIMQQISEAAGGSGAVLLQSDVRTPDVPRTPSVDELIRAYFSEG
jgi:hypothetical protein